MFKTDSNTAALQSRIEQPEIHILAMSVEHQAALITEVGLKKSAKLYKQQTTSLFKDKLKPAAV